MVRNATFSYMFSGGGVIWTLSPSDRALVTLLSSFLHVSCVFFVLWFRLRTGPSRLFRETRNETIKKKSNHKKYMHKLVYGILFVLFSPARLIAVCVFF